MLQHIFNYFVRNIDLVKIATTDEEKEMVFRFRYKIYVEQMKRSFMEFIDHDKKMVYESYDFEKDTIILYLGDLRNIKGTLTLRIWDKGKIPKSAQRKFNTDQFPNIDNLIVSEACYFMIDMYQRGVSTVPLLFDALYDLIIRRGLLLNMVFLTCMPGLVNYYQKFGFRLYTEKLVSLADGLRAPLLLIPNDILYLKKINVPFIFAANKYKKYVANLLDNDFLIIKNSLAKTFPIITVPKDIAKTIETALLNNDICKLMPFLSLQDLTGLCGLIMHVQSNQYILKKGVEDREIYLVLEGEIVVEINNTIMKTLHKGDVFGEMAFFLGSGRRTADIRTVTSVTVAVIRRNDLKRAMKKNQLLAINFLYGITKI